MLPCWTSVYTDDLNLHLRLWSGSAQCTKARCTNFYLCATLRTQTPVTPTLNIKILPVKTLELFHTSAPLNCWQIGWKFLFHYNIRLGRFITNKWNSISSLFIVRALVYRLGGRGRFIVFISAAIRSRMSFHWQRGMVTTTESGFIVGATASWVSISCKQKMSALW